jgi:hypothetical protein
MNTLEALVAARDRLETVTPLALDCGALCGAACCKDSPDEDEVAGMLLFPQEEKLYAHQGAWMELLPSALLFGGSPVPLLTCHVPCPRRHRPLACRLFPLVPYVRDGRLTVRMDVRARPLCPLCGSGIAGLDPAFVSAVKDALRILWADQTHREYLCELTEHLKEYEWL